jgi:NAD(P)-dependent dehydrogenase (short-subunit alcohol dehydrogenase family)
MNAKESLQGKGPVAIVTGASRGIGRAMYEFALNNLKERGAEIACVGTGGDASHAPARRAYQAIGFDKAIPGLHLFKVL